MRFDEVAIEAAGITIANKSMGVGAATGLLGFIASVNWLGVIGAFVAIVGLAVNVYFQVRRDRRESVESNERIAALRDRCEL
ncbi:holin [Alcaligenaceae bacterium]|nr:holin [Alcaligenaceae bacterium]